MGSWARVSSGGLAYRLCRLLALLVAARVSRGAELEEPLVISSTEAVWEVTLSVDVLRHTSTNANFTTRAYCYEGFCSYPGPTIRIKPGDSFTLHLVNDLGPEAEGAAQVHNTMHSPNTTNMHTHGLHIDPNVDTVFVVAPPGENLTYAYELPADHMPGTHWYHAHYHGAATLQLMNGLAGALIVDPGGSENLPSSLTDLEEHVLVFAHMKFDQELDDEGLVSQGCNKQFACDAVWQAPACTALEEESTFDSFRVYSYQETEAETGSLMNADPVWVDGSVEDFYFTNGQFAPTLSMQPDERRVLRMVLATGGLDLKLNFTDQAGLDVCGPFMVIAADGVYFTEPYEDSQVSMSAGNRYDIVVGCREEGTYAIQGFDYNTVLELVIAGNSSPPAANITAEDMAGIIRPFYLTDLQGDDVLVDDFHEVHAHQGSRPDELGCKFWLGGGTDCTPVYLGEVSPSENVTTCPFSVFEGARGDPADNATSGLLPPYKFTTTVGHVNEWKFYGVGEHNHPMHLHVHHMQVVNFTYNESETGTAAEEWVDFFKIGQWRDTLPAFTGELTVRFIAADFFGETVFHCHFLRHEDLGMMDTVWVAPGNTTLDGSTTQEELAMDGSFNEELRELAAISSTEAVWGVTLTVGVLRHTSTHANFTTRAYCLDGVCSYPGPTIRVKPGDNFTLTLVNGLGPEADGATPVHNTMHSPNTTNVHTHGLHIDPKVDTMFAEAPPGTSLVYDYQILAEHAPGTHWYHAHYHGSATLQVMNGLAGALIVEPAVELPDSISGLQEHVLVYTHMKFNQEVDDDGLVSQGCASGYACEPEWQAPLCTGDEEDSTFDSFRVYSYQETEAETGSLMNVDPVWVNGTLEDFYLTNGQVAPVLTMQPDERRMLRMVLATGGLELKLNFTDKEALEACGTFMVIAADGVYFTEPYEDDQVSMSAGSRYDMVVGCSVPGTYALQGVGYNTVLQLNITGDSNPPQHNITAEDMADIVRPSYLMDLTGDEVVVQDFHEVHVHQGSRPDELNCTFWMGGGEDCTPVYLGEVPAGENMTTCPFSIFEGARGDPADNATSGLLPPYKFTTTVGHINEWKFYGNGEHNHPMHLHVHHMQVVNVTYSDDAPGAAKWVDYFKIGQWRDTLPAFEGELTVRFLAADFYGETAVHCSFLRHKDLGMMDTVWVAPAPANQTVSADSEDGDIIEPLDSLAEGESLFEQYQTAIIGGVIVVGIALVIFAALIAVRSCTRTVTTTNVPVRKNLNARTITRAYSVSVV